MKKPVLIKAKKGHWLKEKEDKDTCFVCPWKIMEVFFSFLKDIKGPILSKRWLLDLLFSPLDSFGLKEKSFQNFRRVQEAHAERAKAQKEAQARRDAARDKAEAALKETGHLKDGFVLMPERSSGPESQEKDVNEAPEATPEVEIQKEAVEPEPVESVEPEKPEEPDTEEPEIVPFEWTSFKDRCLGRLVAQHRYNFKKVWAILQLWGKEVEF